MGSISNTGAAVVLFCLVAVGLWGLGRGSMEQDEKDCADQLTNMAACIPYVSGTAKKPTPECCDDTKKVKAAKPKCLCVLIKESTDPSLGLPINTTLALQMPSHCNIDAKVSDCPSLLNLPADSPDAKIFKTGDADSTTSSSTGSPPSSASTTSSTSSPSGSSSSDSKATTENGSNSNGAKAGIISFLGLASIAFVFV